MCCAVLCCGVVWCGVMRSHAVSYDVRVRLRVRCQYTSTNQCTTMSIIVSRDIIVLCCMYYIIRRLKCYEQRKSVNALVTSDLRQLAARMSDSPHSSASSVSGGSGATPCLLCLTPFSMFRRQHHCRLCDALCCDECSRKRILVDKAPVW